MRAAALHFHVHSTVFGTLCIMWINCCLNIVQPSSQTTLNAVCQCLTSAMNYPCAWSMPGNGLVTICVWTWKVLVKMWHVVRSLPQWAVCFNFFDSQKWKCLKCVIEQCCRLLRLCTVGWYMNEWAYMIGGMVLTGEEWSTHQKTCPSATLSTRCATWVGLGLSLGLQGDSLVTNCLNHGKVTLNKV